MDISNRSDRQSMHKTFLTEGESPDPRLGSPGRNVDTLAIID